MTERERTGGARAAILGSIRDHLAASAQHNAVYYEIKAGEDSGGVHHRNEPSSPGPLEDRACEANHPRSLVEVFQENLAAVGGHCVVARDESEVVEALTRIITSLQRSPLRARRLALSDAPVVERLIGEIGVGIDLVAIAPGPPAIFEYDVGITSAQAAIAETGTLVLDAGHERHRLVSLVPPVHIAIVEAKDIFLTLGEALSALHRAGSQGAELSHAVTFITGPSRTADIELTLAIGVHGPQELYVIIKDTSTAID